MICTHSHALLFLPSKRHLIHIAKCSQCRVFLQRSFFDTLVAYLSLHDIHLLISALECLHSLSCLGEHSCNAIVRTHGALDALVSLVTVEAQSYGPKACILMRVVETVPGTSSAAAAAQAQQQQQQQQQQQHPQAHQAAAAAVQAAGAQKAVAQLGALSPVVRQAAPGQQVVKVVSAGPPNAATPGKTIVTTAGGQVSPIINLSLLHDVKEEFLPPMV